MNLTPKIKRLGTALFGALILAAGCSASGGDGSPEGQPLPTADRIPGYNAVESIETSVGRSTGVTLIGMGVELDPHFLSQNVTRRDGTKASDWEEVIAPRIRKMEVERFRVMLQPHWWEPINDNGDPAVTNLRGFTFQSQEMLSLYKVLDTAQELGIEVTLVLWGCPTSCDQIDPAYGYIGRHFLCSPNGTNWVVEPANDEEFAESFSTVVKYLIEERGYTCIKELTPYNEPDGNITTLEKYIPLVRVLDKRLRTDNIRQLVHLNLSDNTDTRLFFLEGCAANLAPQADLFNSHTYIFGYETPNRTILDWERANVAAAQRASKNHFVGEFGSNQCVGATRQRDIDRYDRGVLMTRLVVNFLNAGAVGASYWSLIDQYYNRYASYTEMQQLGLWRHLRNTYLQDPDQTIHPSLKVDYQVRPQYYAYSLLTRLIRKGAEVYPLELNDDFAAATAIRNSNGKWSYIFANGSNHDISIDLSNSLGDGMTACKVYHYEERMLPDTDMLIAPSLLLKNSGQTFKLYIRAQGVLALTQ